MLKFDPAVYGEATGLWYGLLSFRGYQVRLARFAGLGYRAVIE